MDEWVETEFKTDLFGDRRLFKRMKKIVAQLAKTPRQSIASTLQGWAEVIAAYRFFNNPKTSVQNVLSSHCQAIRERAKQHKRILVVQDTTELDFTPKKGLNESGPLSTKKRRGFFAHNHVVITPERLHLGVLDTHIYARKDEEHGKSEKRKQLPIEEKESYRWLEGYRKACQFAQDVPGTQVISCSDREGDIYEFFEEWQKQKQSDNIAAEWLIRSRDDRNIISCETTSDQDENSAAHHLKLRHAVEVAPLLGTISIQIKAKTQMKKKKGGSRVKTFRSARLAKLEVRITRLTLKPPYRKDRKLAEVTFSVVMCKELQPPQDEDPIRWYLLTSLMVSGFDSACDIIDLCSARWEIEVFQRVLKTGCRVEELQLKNNERVFVAVALYMIVAWRVLYVMKLGRECPELPCDVVFNEDEWQAFWVIVHGEKAVNRKPSLGEFVNKLAEFGGFLGRKSDGSPGPQSIWIGLGRIRDFAFAWQHFGKGYYPGTQ